MKKQKEFNAETDKSVKVMFFIMIFLLFIISLIFFIKWLDEPEFKITKEECQEKYAEFSINREHQQIIRLSDADLLFVIEGSNTMVCGTNQTLCKVRANIGNVCEQVEVDEIVLSSYLLFINYDFNNETLLIPFYSCEEISNLEVKCNIPIGKILDPSTDKIPNIDILISSSNTKITPIKISKEDLSIDWLSEKAKCIEYYPNAQCSKYKLNEYEIEVLK